MSAEYKSELPLVGINGNAYSVMAVVDRGLKEAGAPFAYRKSVLDDMQSGDYEHLLAVAVAHTTDDALAKDARDDEYGY